MRERQRGSNNSPNNSHALQAFEACAGSPLGGVVSRQEIERQRHGLKLQAGKTGIVPRSRLLRHPAILAAPKSLSTTFA